MDTSLQGFTSDPLTRRLAGFTQYGQYVDCPYMTEIIPGLWQGGAENGLVLPGFIEHLVSLCTSSQYDVRHQLASHLTVPMSDSGDQQMDDVDRIAIWALDSRDNGPVLVHCRAGLNRSGLIVARALILDGMPAGDAIALIRERRSPCALCNPVFEEWLRKDRP